MRIDIHKLPLQLKQPLLPVYLVAGDEPLQRIEAVDLIRSTARTQGYTEREILEHGAQFDWRQLAISAMARSLFGERRLIELRLASSKIGTVGSAALVAYLQSPVPDTLLLIVSPKLERTQGGAKWLQLVEQQGVLVSIWPVGRSQLDAWLERRMRSRGLVVEAGGAAWLAEHVEGNLLAGVQEVEKLLLLRGPGSVSLEQIRAAVADSAHYTVFDLADSAVAGQAARCVRILHTLQGEGTASALVLWALVKEVRLLAGLALRVQSGMPAPQAVAGRRNIRERQRPLYATAVARLSPQRWQQLLLQCVAADRAIKGVDAVDPWRLLEQIALGMAGVAALAG